MFDIKATVVSPTAMFVHVNYDIHWLIYTFMRGQSARDKMSIQRFTDIRMPITHVLPQNP